MTETASTTSEIDSAVATLSANCQRWANTDLPGRVSLLQRCLQGVAHNAQEWVDLANEAKRLTPEHPAYNEDIATGPIVVARHLRLLIQTYEEMKSGEVGPLGARVSTSPTGRTFVRVIPAVGLPDWLSLLGFSADVRMPTGVSVDDVKQQLSSRGSDLGSQPVKIAFILGAGNVSSIPATDTLHKLFVENQLVLLKMSPVNAWFGPVLKRIFKPLVEAGFLQIAYGGAEVGRAGIAHPQVDEIHITGGTHTHDRIVWGENVEEQKATGEPLLQKPITSELGNVSPWIVIPGKYSPRELAYQAENVATSITHNVSFNCVATKVVITDRNWPQREAFLNEVQERLQAAAPRYAYYPGARQRYEEFIDEQLPPDTEELPFTFLCDVDPDESPRFFEQESFTPVCVETTLQSDSAISFLQQAVEFCNDRLWGTLSATVTVPPLLRENKTNETLLARTLEDLHYGTIGINQWPAAAYLMGACPWGGYPGATLQNVQSGIGWVHNTVLLRGMEKTIMQGPLVSMPHPPWFASHPDASSVYWRMLDMLCKPSIWATARFLFAAMRAPFYRRST